MADDDSEDEADEAAEEEVAEGEKGAEGEEAEEEENVDEEVETAADGEGAPVPVGVKLGSTRTVLVVGEDDPETTRTLTCLATYEDALTGEEEYLFGEEAAREYPESVEFMLRSGLPEDDERAELASIFFREVLEANGVPENSGVVYAIPTIDNEEGLDNLTTVVESSPIGDALLRSYPESLCGALPAFDDELAAIDEIFLAVNMGSTNLEVCAYRRGEQLAPVTTGAVTGNEVDRRIANYVEEETQGRVNIDPTTAREYKEEHADFDSFEPFSDIIQQPGGGSHEFTVEDSVMDACDEYLDEAVEEVANGFLPELANDYMKVYQIALDEPVVLTGGMACLPGIVEEFEERLEEALDREVDVIAPDRPDLAAARGAHVIARRLLD